MSSKEKTFEEIIQLKCIKENFYYSYALFESKHRYKNTKKLHNYIYIILYLLEYIVITVSFIMNHVFHSDRIKKIRYTREHICRL